MFCPHPPLSPWLHVPTHSRARCLSGGGGGAKGPETCNIRRCTAFPAWPLSSALPAGPRSCVHSDGCTPVSHTVSHHNTEKSGHL